MLALLLLLLMRPLVEYPEPGVLAFNWNAPQSRFKNIRAVPNGPIQYINYEGAVRAGKTTAPASKACDYAIEYPGIHMGAARWKDTDLFAQVVPAWRDMCRRYGLSTKWHPDEQYDEIKPYGSRMYLRALHTNELDSRYSKLAGLTLAVLWVDQPEEVPEDVVDAYVPARLSQPGYPKELWLTPNPVDETDHWLAKWFPSDQRKQKPNHHFIQTALYDNVSGVGQQYITDMEDKYPAGHPLRRRFIEGLRGLSIVGTPVYGGVFVRKMHVDPTVEFDPDLPLLESYDFGHRHPAVLWSQFVRGAWHVLGEAMGHNQFIEDFAPWVVQQRTALFREIQEVWGCCDPARNNQGLQNDAVTVLQQHGLHPRWVDGSNNPVMRDAAVQKLAAALQRLHAGKPAVRIHPRCRLFLDGLEAGYIWDERSIVNSASPNTRRPKKDGTYDHLQNCAEYTWLNFGPAYMTPTEAAKADVALERRINAARRDTDPLDRMYGKGRFKNQGTGRRGGW
jgi:PBSX family phage terminase large subunit